MHIHVRMFMLKSCIQTNLHKPLSETTAICFFAFGRRVRHLFVGTHGRRIHRHLRAWLVAHGFEVDFDYAPWGRSCYGSLKQFLPVWEQSFRPAHTSADLEIKAPVMLSMIQDCCRCFVGAISSDRAFDNCPQPCKLLIRSCPFMEVPS